MGWYGFNAGSALSAGPVAAYAISATTVASCVGVIIWSLLSLIQHRHVHTVAVLNGAIAGMAGITPASGYIESYWAAILAVIIVLGAYAGIWILKGKLKIDDALDVSSVHGITGIIGSLAIGFIASSEVNPQGPNGWFYGNPSQIYIQAGGVALAVAWSAFWTIVLVNLFRFSKFFKLTVEEEIEILGLDYYYHGDVAYHSLEAPEDEEIVDERDSLLRRSQPEAGYLTPEIVNIQNQTTSARLPTRNLDIHSIPLETRKTLSARWGSDVRV